MRKIDKLNKSKSMLEQAVQTMMSAMPNNRDVVEAKRNVLKAIKNLNEAASRTSSKKSKEVTQHNQWWESIQSGVASSNLTAEACTKSLNVLNAMINEEKSKLDEIEKAQEENEAKSTNFGLLSD